MPSIRLLSPASDVVALRRSGLALGAVGLLFLVLQHVLVPGTMGLSIDEATYLAKVDPDVPEQYWEQVRAWGVPVLAAPVAAFSPGTGAVRAWFSLLSSGGLVAAFWPWRRVLHPAVAPLAALLLATTWYVLLYASLVMPNLYVALGAVATTGLFLRAAQTSRRSTALAAGAAAGFVALVRPSDSLLLLLGVLACALVVSRLRALPALVALVVGTALGWVPWVVEAYTRFDGPVARLRGGNEAGLKGGVEANLTTLNTYPRLLDGSPNYCCYGDPASDAGPLPLLFTAWYVVVPLLAVFGLLAARRRGRAAEVAVALVPAALFAGFYVLLLPFGSVRFLIPITALLALPVAAGLVAVGARRGLALVLVALVVVGHLGLMLRKAARELPATAEAREGNERVARAAEALVSRRPCVVVGRKPQVRSYYLGCRPQMVRPVTAEPPPRVRAALEQGGSVIALLTGPPPADSYLATWQRVPLPGARRSVQAYVPPPGWTYSGDPAGR